MAKCLQLIRLEQPSTYSPFMDIPTELRCQIYGYLLTAEGGATYAVVSTTELKYRAVLRKLRQDDSEPLERPRMRQIARDFGLVDQDQDCVETTHEGEGEYQPRFHVAILRVNRQVYEEAKDTIYERNTIMVAPNLSRQNEPLHYQFVDGIKLSAIRYLRLDLHENGGHGWPQSRSYGIWTTLLHLPSLRELKLVVHLCKKHSKRADGTWDLSTFCAKTIRNMVAALPKKVKLIGIEEPIAHGEDGGDDESRFASAQEVRELFCQFDRDRGVDAEIWETEMECMSPPVSPKAGGEDARVASSDELAVVS
ncbi:hypothetical protein CC86DRAFT_198624 [Ophiobolus disseminans]|uniref:DUF7730 domain-containing protein n=1 Tax=Ophiobolus disseminans TaxID=1469910 RepID=A0A6A7A7V0_9PLEO|nr:hypothetical protein CC86DRAFT_198624 [Ophiobolus disseminans]